MVRLLPVLTLLSGVRLTPVELGSQLEPCRNASTNEEGFCMFAFDCYKAGGRHVAVCMKGFYYGSCCHASQPPANINDVDSLLDFGWWSRLSSSAFFHPPADAIDARVKSPLKDSLVSETIDNATQVTIIHENASNLINDSQTINETSTTSSTSTDLITSTTTIKTPVINDINVTVLPFIMTSSTNKDMALPNALIVAISDSVTVNHNKAEVCGKPIYRWPKIVSGENARPGQWPWMVSVQVRTRRGYYHKCGAALLTREWALTAAHCLINVPEENILVKYGGLDFASIKDKFFESRVLSFLHPKFSLKTQRFDVALLKLLTPVEYQFNALPICLPDRGMVFDYDQSIVAGWGKLAEKGFVSTKLQYVEIPIMNNTECQTIYKRINKLIDKDLMCAGYPIGMKDSCEGDSGGPMMVFKGGRWVAAGIVSWGVGCARPNQPGVSTRITEFLDWIYSYVSPERR